MKWLKQLLCCHHWIIKIYSKDCYDEEMWLECKKCNKQLDSK